MFLKLRKQAILLVALLLTFPLLLPVSAARPPFREKRELGKVDRPYLDEVVVKFKPGTSFLQINEFNRRLGTHFTRSRPFADFVTLKIPTGQDAKGFAGRLATDPRVEYAEPNYLAYALMVPNDSYYGYQWHLDNPVYGGIGMEEAWDVASGSGVTVAIIDTGIAFENYQESRWRKYEQAPDLAQTCFVQGHDFVNDDEHPNDDSSPGHGTHVAGTVAQSTNNNLGVAGVAFNSCLMPVKVLGSSGSGTYADVAEGIRWAADNGAKVINLSLGGSASSDTLKNAVKYAYEKGVTVVAAAGNESSNKILYPAAYDDYVIAVGATRYDETLAYYSNFGPSLDLVAPGGDLKVDQNKDGYGDGVLQQTYENGWRGVSWGYYFMNGTSMATPHVSGVSALLIGKGKASTPGEVRAVLETNAKDLGTLGRDDVYGWGLVDAATALGVTSTSTSSPSPTPTPTATPTPTPTSTPTPSPTPTLGPSPTPTPTPSPSPTPTPTPSPSPTPTPTPEGPGVKCWKGEYQYLYRNRDQAKKFCKCAQGTYGYKSYSYSWGRKTVYQYLDSSDNENWEVTSSSSYLPVYEVTCTDGKAYSTDKDYSRP